MEEAWKKIVTENFNPSWINVIDEIIMYWYNKFSPIFTCITLDDLEGGNTKRNYKGRDGESLVKIFK